VHVPKLARTSSKGTPKGTNRNGTPRTPGGGWGEAAIASVSSPVRAPWVTLRASLGDAKSLAG
jgi:hypothetical protein